MESNQINLFKQEYFDGSYSIDTHNGDWRWGGYVEKLQGWLYGEDLTLRLTGYYYANYYLETILVEY